MRVLPCPPFRAAIDIPANGAHGPVKRPPYKWLVVAPDIAQLKDMFLVSVERDFRLSEYVVLVGSRLGFVIDCIHVGKVSME